MCVVIINNARWKQIKDLKWSKKDSSSLRKLISLELGLEHSQKDSSSLRKS